MTKKKGKILKGRLTEREIEACRWVCEQGVMTAEQLWRAVWWKERIKKPTYALLRMQLLEQRGLVKSFRTCFSGKMYLKATKFGFRQVYPGVEIQPLGLPKALYEIGKQELAPFKEQRVRTVEMLLAELTTSIPQGEVPHR